MWRRKVTKYSKPESAPKPMVAVEEVPESGLEDAWRAMRDFFLSKQEMARMARLGDSETWRRGDGDPGPFGHRR